MEKSDEGTGEIIYILLVKSYAEGYAGVYSGPVVPQDDAEGYGEEYGEGYGDHEYIGSGTGSAEDVAETYGSRTSSEGEGSTIIIVMPFPNGVGLTDGSAVYGSVGMLDGKGGAVHIGSDMGAGELDSSGAKGSSITSALGEAPMASPSSCDGVYAGVVNVAIGSGDADTSIVAIVRDVM